MNNYSFNSEKYHNNIPYVETINVKMDCDSVFRGFEDFIQQTTLKFEEKSDKKRIFELYKDCTPFDKEDAKKLDKYIEDISFNVTGSILDYYD